MHVLMQTTLGDFVLELDAEKAPVSTANMASYVESGHYNGTIFHRVIDGFMVQGGGFTAEMQQKPVRESIANEWKNGLKNTRGAVAMARIGGRPDSATCQFFINVVDNSFLDRPQPDGAAYAVVGRVVKGMDVVDKIRVVPTGTRAGMGDVPKTPVVIESARKLSPDEAKTLGV